MRRKLYKNGNLIPERLEVPEDAFSSPGYDPDDLKSVLKVDFDGDGNEEELFIADKQIYSNCYVAFVLYDEGKYKYLSECKLYSDAWSIGAPEISRDDAGTIFFTVDYHSREMKLELRIEDGNVRLYNNGIKLSQNIYFSYEHEIL